MTALEKLEKMIRQQMKRRHGHDDFDILSTEKNFDGLEVHYAEFMDSLVLRLGPRDADGNLTCSEPTVHKMTFKWKAKT